MSSSDAAGTQGYEPQEKMRQIPETWTDCIGLALREWRLDRGLTVEAAGRRAGVSTASWSRWEGGTAAAPFEALVAAAVPTEVVAKRAIALAEEHGIQRARRPA